MTAFLSIVGVFGLVAALWSLWRHLEQRRISRQRVFDFAPGESTDGAGGAQEHEPGWLGWWLIHAGYQSPAASSLFLLATAVLMVLGGVAVLFFYRSGLLPLFLRGLDEVPSGIGDIFVPFAYGAPWLIFAFLTCLPILAVRASRRRRVARVEQDLPITLELLATLAESGIGFDAALDRILNSQSAERPLARELRQFQVELLAGRPRADCLRRLGRRLDVTSLSLFVSALSQATQIGAGLSDVLRRQVEDLRNRRRERALTLASTLPVKLLFPLVVCFLPGILIAILGPAFYQYFQLLDNLNRSRGR